jgi:hypothetical protein
MNIQDLIEALTELAEDNPDAEVRIAYQPNYPLAAYVQNVTVVDADDEDEDRSESESVIWIAASDTVSHRHSPYAPKSAWDN